MSAPALSSRLPEDLLRRFDAPGPRYTSYPTADRFVEAFGPDDVLRALAQRAQVARFGGTAPLSVYVHIPFCESVCYYCACNKVITKHHERATAYLDALDTEIGLVSNALGAPQRGEDVLQLGVGQKGRRAAAEVQLRHRLAGAELAHDQRDLVVERVEVLGRALVVLRDDLVAGAVVADRFAERHVQVDRQRRAFDAAGAAWPLRHRVARVGAAEARAEAVGRGIRGVARAGFVEALQQALGQLRGGVGACVCVCGGGGARRGGGGRGRKRGRCAHGVIVPARRCRALDAAQGAPLRPDAAWAAQRFGPGPGPSSRCVIAPEVAITAQKIRKVTE